MIRNSQKSIQTQLAKQGFCLVGKVFKQAQIDAALKQLRSLDTKRAGARDLLAKRPSLLDWLRTDAFGELVYAVLGTNASLVRTLYFNKTATTNWKVGWHQDQTIAVKQRIEIAGFRGWSTKESIPHVQAPAAILQQMLICRIHLDPANAINGALNVLPGSHKQGLLNKAGMAQRARTASVTCTAQAGDVLLMRPLLAHASKRSLTPKPRRVVHLEFAPCDLPCPLKWHENVPLSI